MRNRVISKTYEKRKFKLRIKPDELMIIFEIVISRNQNSEKKFNKSKSNCICKIKDVVNRFLLPILLSGAGSGLWEITKLIILLILIKVSGSNQIY